mgnify:FL=1
MGGCKYGPAIEIDRVALVMSDLACAQDPGVHQHRPQAMPCSFIYYESVATRFSGGFFLPYRLPPSLALLSSSLTAGVMITPRDS